ncbi:MAG: PAS domain S-box protein [Cyanophyceae cyanobacterium]
MNAPSSSERHHPQNSPPPKLISGDTRQDKAANKEIELYEEIVRNMQFGMCVWRLEKLDELRSFRLVAVNPAAARILGVALEECVGQKIQECFPNALSTFHQEAVAAYAEVVRTQQAQELGEVYYDDARVSGGVFAIKAFPLPGQCVGVAFEDITERKQTEAALAASERQYRTVVNSIKEIIFQTDTAGCWTFLNPAWTEITGFELDESLQTALTDYIYAEEDQKRCRERLAALIAGKQDFFQYEFRLLTRCGDFRWLEIEAQAYHSEAGSVLGTFGTIIDTTERKQTEAVLQSRADELSRINTVLLATAAQLEKRNQELDQFAYVTSHDLKAPLRAIANLSQWIEEDLADRLDEDTRHQMSLLRGRVHRMEALINGLLEYSRVGRLKSKPEAIAVGALLNDVIDSLSPPQEFTILIEEMPTLKTRRLPLQQVFANLISNAVKHHDRSTGTIRISGQEQGSLYEFAVSDDGPGIAPEYQEKVFAIFQTLEARDKTENTGIGLSIVKKIVENQGGTVQLTSELGKGTTFRFTWPK